MSALKTAITHRHQRYLDEPIIVRPKEAPGARTSIAVQAALDPNGFFAERVRAPITVGYERVLLRWMTSDGKGGLITREGKR